MVQYNKNIKNKKKGFTLVELMVVLAITAILAVLVGGGLIAYTRLARFEKNEANARTLFQTAQISLTRMETAGELDAFRDKVTKSGSMGQHFAEGLTDANGKPLDGRTQKDLNTYIAALYYDKTGAADGNHNAAGRLHLRRLTAECLDLCRDRRAERAGLLGLLRYQIR